MILSAEPLRRVLEIGTYIGGSLWFFSQLATDDALLVTVDHKPELFQSFSHKEQRIVQVAGDSLAVRDRVVEVLGPEPIDFLFIDGNHQLDGAQRDWEIYGDLVRSGGLVAFHDIVFDHPDCGVPDFWRELRPTVAVSYDIRGESDDGTCGIGIVRMR